MQTQKDITVALPMKPGQMSQLIAGATLPVCLVAVACAEKVVISDIASTFRLCESQAEEACQAEESHLPKAYLRVTLKSDRELAPIAKRLEIAELYGIAKGCDTATESSVTTSLMQNSDDTYTAVFKVYSPRYSDIRDVLAGLDNAESSGVCFSVGGGSVWARLDSNAVRLPK